MYPASSVARDRFVLDRRQPRPIHDPWRYQGLIVEDELTDAGRVARVATVLLTGRECPWRCVMCDLWKSTTASDTPYGAIGAQIDAARHELQARGETVTQVKLYNAGSFFDGRAVPEKDYAAIAAALTGLERIVVESHPALVGPPVDRFLEALDRHRAPGPEGAATQLEVAMGLETVHPEALEALHKRMTLDDFKRAADGLQLRGAALRVFLLIAPPFIPDVEQDLWLRESIEAAFASGATVVSLVPTRPGNGALEALTADGRFHPPCLDDIERTVALGLGDLARRMDNPVRRLFVDLWDLRRFSSCPSCFEARRSRLHRMNLTQRVLPPIMCATCSASRVL